MKNRISKVLGLLLVAMTILSVMSVSASAVSKATHYTIKGLQSGNAVQKAVIWGNYVYAIQRSDSRKDSWITQCKIEGNAAVAVGKRMTLQNFGHAQSLEPFTYGGKTYFWVNCKNNSSTDAQWGIQVARIQFKDDTTLNYTSCPRLSFGNVTRVEFALSSDASEILFWVNNNSKITYSAYKTADINKKLDAKAKEQSHYINISNFSEIFSTTSCTGSYYRPYRSNQGLEFTDGRSIYIAGNETVNEKSTGRIGIFKLVRSGSGYKATNQGKWWEKIPNGAEIEGIQLKGDRVYFSVTDKSKGKNNGRFVIYSIPKSAFN